tara:strand:- start:102 stop:770 length:669 start_codon:yes stop_codon:yes gene_type:complete
VKYTDISRSIEVKNLNQLTLLEFAFVHINGRKVNEIKDGILFSVIPVVLREIGHAKENIYSDNFLPVSAVFTVLDQLGFCYSRNDMEPYEHSNASGIKKALYYFCDFSPNDEDSKALVALRNSFLHTASCLSKAMYDSQPNYNFSFDKNSDVLIRHPDVKWNGDFESLSEDMWTYINPIILIKLAEAAVEEALNCLYKGVLQVSCEGGGKELRHRFLKFQPK